VVFTRDVVAVGAGGADHVTVDFARADAEPDGVRRVPDQDLGRLFGRAAIDRLVLGEAGEPRRVAPDVLVELAVDDRSGLDPGNDDFQAAGAAVVGERVLEGQECGEEHGRNLVNRRAV